EAPPLVIGSMYAQIQKLPLRRQLSGRCSKEIAASSFVPQIGYSSSISRRVLYPLPMELDQAGVPGELALKRVVAPVSEVELTKEIFAENVRVSRGPNDFQGVTNFRWWNEQVDIGAGTTSRVFKERICQSNAFERHSRDSSIA